MMHNVLGAAPHNNFYVGEAARILGIHPDTLRRWEKKGIISVLRHPANRYRMIPASEITRILELCKK